MSSLNRRPGPMAGSAFRLGMMALAIVGLAAVALSFWLGLIGPFVLVFALLVLFPVYLVVAASLLSVWLGFDKDVTDLRPVYRERERGS